MSTIGRIKAVFRAIVEQMERDPKFSDSIGEILGETAKPTAEKSERKGRRKPGPFDPFDAYDKGVLEESLADLNVEQLKDIIAEHRMDRSTKAMKWKTKERLIPFILTIVSARSRKGEAFRLARPQANDAAANTFPVAAVDSPEAQAALRDADVVEVCNTNGGMHQQLWGQNTVPNARNAGAAPYVVKHVAIEIDFNRVDELERAKAAVDRAKGRTDQ